MPKQKETPGKTSTSSSSKQEENLDLENILHKLALGMVNLQKTVGALADNLQQSNALMAGSHENVDKERILDDRSYILHWRELGGSNLSFYPNNKTHPMQFLKKLNKTLEDAGVPEKCKINLAVNCLNGGAADWVATKEGSFKKYDDFIFAFTERYWGLDKQRELFRELNYGQYETGNRSDYFLNLVNQAKFLSEQMSEVELIEKLSKHFQTEIRRGIIIQGLCTIDSVEQYLRQVDETYVVGQGRENTAAQHNMNRNSENRRYEPPRFNRNSVRNVNSQQNRNTNNVTNDRREGRSDNRQNINLITHFNQCPEWLLESDDEVENKEKDVAVVPVIQASVGNDKGQENVEILIDSGSEVSAISQTFFEKLKLKFNVPILPVTGVTIAVAVGGKVQRVRQQILLPITINNDITVECVCLVIPHLNRDLLWGTDILLKHKACIDFENLQFKINIEGVFHTLDFMYRVCDEKSISINLCKESEKTTLNRDSNFRNKHEYNETDFQLTVHRSNLTCDSDKAKLFAILKDNRSLFSENPGIVNCYEHEVMMTDDTPFYERTYPIPYIYREEVSNQIKEMLELGIVSTEKTEYVSPLVVVTKKDKSIRICLDARYLNKRMGKDYIPPPNANELLMNFKKGQIMSTIDLTAAYWQVPIKREHRKFVGFLYENQTYVFNVLPFGLSTSMASLIRCVSRVLGAECVDFTICYVDDLFIFSDNIEQHFSHLAIIFEKLKTAGLTVKLRKSQFIRDQVSFLGHIISADGISIDVNRIRAIRDFPVPRNLKQLRGFLGLVNYERQFCKNYADMTIPLLNLLKKGIQWNWGVEQSDAFLKIKESFINAMLLKHPNLNEIFYVQCDSSDYGLGGCLYQIDSDSGEKNIVAFTSRTLRNNELQYTVTEKETLAIIHCFRQWRTLILGRQIVVVTDHKSLMFLLTCKLRSARLTRWVMFLQEFDFVVVHCKGADNVIADVLSRQPLKIDSAKEQPDSTTNVEISLITLSPNYKELKKNFKNIRQDQLSEDCFKIKIEFLENVNREVKVFTDKELQVGNWYILHEGVLFRRGTSSNGGFKLCVPKSQRVELVRVMHEEIGHFGGAKTYAHMKSKFYWPRMQKHIRQFVASCDLCQKSKISKTSIGLLNPVIATKPGELVCLDLMGPLPKSRGGTTVLLVLVDAFSKYVKLYALKRATAATILNRITKSYIPTVQKPKCLLSDNGTQFTSNLWKNTLDNLGIQRKTTSVYFPQGNMTERYNREIGRLLRIFCYEKHTKWAYVIDTVEVLLNSVVNDSTGFTADFVQRGIKTSNSIEKVIQFPDDNNSEPLTLEQIWVLARQKLMAKAERRAAKANDKRYPVIFKEGDRVLVRAHTLSSAENHTIRKFFLLYEGPFYILRQVGPNSYLIGDETGRAIAKHNVVNLKTYKSPNVNDE